MKKGEQPAFANIQVFGNANGDEAIGLTVRDYFASHAMQGIISGIYAIFSGKLVEPEDFLDKMEKAIKNSYWIADKMLEQREV